MTKSASHWLFEGDTNVGRSLPNDAAFSQGTTRVERKIKFGGEVVTTLKLQAGAMIAQIADGAIDRQTRRQNELGALG